MTHRLPWTLTAWRVGATLVSPLAGPFLARRAARGKEDPLRSAEKRGRIIMTRPAGRIAWVHGASVGETLSLLPLIERLIQRGLFVLVTSGTATSANVLASRLPAGAAHQFAPLDAPPFVRRFLDHWRPDLILFAESELWPNTVIEASRRAIPMALVNARVSLRSAQRWGRLPATIAALLDRFEGVIAQTEPDADRFRALGAPHVLMAGNLKFDVAPPPADPIRLAALRGACAGRPGFLAASTHPGEDEVVLMAHAALKRRFPGLITVIAPRHPERGGAIAELARQAGLAPARRALGLMPDAGCDVYVADTIGELGLFYRLCPIAFIGGSLARHGGQNPIEPAKLGAAILHGPHVHNFAEVYRALDAEHAAIPIGDAASLAAAAATLLSEPRAMRDMTRRASEQVERISGAINRTMDALEPYLAALALEPGR